MTAPLVFLHGFLGGPRAWDDVRAHLGPDVVANAVALPGHGPEPWIPGLAAGVDPRSERSLRGLVSCTTFEGAVDAIAARLPERAHLVGYSLGARTALGIAARHPSRVLSLVLVGVSPGLEGKAERSARRASDEELARELEQKELAAFVDAWEALPLFATQKSLPDAARARRRTARLAHVPCALAWSLRAMGLGAMPSLWDELAALAMPVHLVTGACDTKFTEIGQRALARAPRAMHTVVGGAGHDVTLEAPEALASVVRAAVTRASYRATDRNAASTPLPSVNSVA